MSQSAVTVLLIRHARSVANAEGILAGRLPGIELDEDGIEQSNLLASKLKNLPIEFVVHSDLERTKKTVAPLISERNLKNVEDVAFTECDYGDWSGRKLSELALEPLWKDIQTRPSSVRFPRGESMVEMQERAVGGLEHWTQKADSLFAICSHGDVIKSMVAYCIGLPLDCFQSLHVAPASLTVVRRSHDGWALLTLNQSVGDDVVKGLALAAMPTIGGGDVDAGTV